MSDAAPSTSGKAGKTKAVEEPPKPAFKPAKYGLYEKQVADYIKTATAKNIWYYRYAIYFPFYPCIALFFKHFYHLIKFHPSPADIYFSIIFLLILETE
jgi:hypothetical protein